MHDGLLGLFHVFRSTQARYRVVITGLTYVVAWSAHGDALSVSEVDPATGGATAANRYSYQTWGRPATTTANGYPDLRFRYLWVGASDVQWDDAAGEALYYMHARSYSPALGRFLQPDPARADGSLYAYAGNSPITKSDPSGLDASCDPIANPTWRFGCDLGFLLWGYSGVAIGIFVTIFILPTTVGYGGCHAGKGYSICSGSNWLLSKEQKILNGKRMGRRTMLEKLGRPGNWDAQNHWERNLRGIEEEINVILRRHPQWRQLSDPPDNTQGGGR